MYYAPAYMYFICLRIVQTVGASDFDNDSVWTGESFGLFRSSKYTFEALVWSKALKSFITNNLDVYYASYH